MRIGELGGEFGVIERIAARSGFGYREGVPYETTASSIRRGSVKLNCAVSVGIGDDAAALSPPSSEAVVLFTTDLMIEDIHFRRSWIDPFHLGWKAVVVNLSDIAAMGGTPTATFVTLALPSDTEVSFLDEMYRGIDAACARFGSVVAGGDTNASPGTIMLGISQMGTVAEGEMLLRSGAHPGDRIIVTGSLGGAAAGLALLETHGRHSAEVASREAVLMHLAPNPRIAEGRAAAAAYGVTAAMDLSDGLIGDLQKLCRASGVGATIDARLVPVAAAARRVGAQEGKNELLWALHGGEDYELLLTVSSDRVNHVCKAISDAAGISCSIIGTIMEGEDVKLIGDGGEAGQPTGWDHFARNW